MIKVTEAQLLNIIKIARWVLSSESLAGVLWPAMEIDLGLTSDELAELNKIATFMLMSEYPTHLTEEYGIVYYNATGLAKDAVKMQRAITEAYYSLYESDSVNWDGVHTALEDYVNQDYLAELNGIQ